MKAFVTAPFESAQLERLRSIMPVIHEDWRETKHIFFDPREFAERLRDEGCDVIITEADEIRAALFDAVPIRMVGTCRGTPVNVDCDDAAQRGIPVFHTPARNAAAVADLALCFMLMLMRHVAPAMAWVRGDRPERPDANQFITMYESVTGIEFHQRTVGLVGLGAIGQGVARRVQAFGARVIAFDPYQGDDVFTAVGAERAELDEVLAHSHILSLHVPDVEETKGMLGAREVARIRDGAYFINTARAASVDEDALFEALASGRLAGAAFDVMWDEPVKADDRFVQLPNVVVTPHIGGATFDVITHQSAMIVDSIEAWLAGKRPSFLANPTVLDVAGR